MGKQVCEKFGLIKGSIVARGNSRLSLMGAMTLSIHHSFPPA